MEKSYMNNCEMTYIEKRLEDELLRIEAWGNNSLRIRAFPTGIFEEHVNALTESVPNSHCKVIIHENGNLEIKNGKISAIIDHRNKISFFNEKGELILQEFIRLRAVKHDDGSEDISTISVTKDFNSTLKLKSREYQANNHGSDFAVKARFESNPNEKIFGMGQYQHEFLDLKNTVLELAQRNSQFSTPFYLSSLGYGFLWNNPGIGSVTFAKNLTEWSMRATTYIDYWITVGDTPKEILNQYCLVTGFAPLMPKRLLGLWQSKLRYRTPQEVLDVLEGYRRRNIQLSTIAIDYFHWPKQGEYRFDEKFWPNVKELISEIKNHYNVEPIISIWPTVQSDANNFQTYQQNGYLIGINKGIRFSMNIQGQTTFIDTTNQEACQYVWQQIEANYKKNGINYYWIDVAEPGYAVYDFDNYRYQKGPVLQCGNLYPIGYLKMIFDGNCQQDSEVILVRGAWAGAQKYGALPWSGDIDSSFESLRNQVNTGLNVGMAGLPWWTTDIGGFHGGNADDPEFRELMIRWFQYSTFSPILRMHGDRLPHSKSLSNEGGGKMPTGAPNEIWSFGSEVENIMMRFIRIRDGLKEYLYHLMKEAHDFGYPVMRSLFFEYPNDSMAWDVDNTYMLGDSILVAPIVDYQLRERIVYLPDDREWVHLFSEKEYQGGSSYLIQAPLDEIPVFIVKNKWREISTYLGSI